MYLPLEGLGSFPEYLGDREAVQNKETLVLLAVYSYCGLVYYDLAA